MTAVFSKAADGNAKRWQLLFNNKPQEAKAVFLANSGTKNPVIAGEAFRGLSEVEEYLGNEPEACRDVFLSYLKDGNELYATCPLNKVIGFSRAGWGYRIREGYQVISSIIRKPGHFAAQCQEELASRYLNDGEVGKAKAIVR